MISKYLLADSKSRLDWIATGYFSFSATEGRQNLIQVYASFLLQVLAFATSMYPRIIEACSANPKGEWNEKDLETLLEEALAIFPRRRVILVLDALDECHAFGSEVLCVITKVCRKAPWCKVLVTSRPKEGMPREEDVAELNLDKEPGLEADIKLFIADRVNLLMKARPFFAPLKSEIAKRLNERADGMFLLVEHIHRSLLNLKGTSRNSIRQVLRSLPRTLADAYSQTFDRVQPEDIEFGSNVLICLLYAARPMTVSELAVAIAITEETPNFTEMADDVALSVLYDINTRIGPIVTISNDYISLIHTSMKDFLLSTVNSDLADTANSEGASSRNLRRDPRKWYIIDRAEANNDLLSRCMKYLSLYFLESKGRLDRLPRALSPASQQVNNEENFEPNSKECEGFLSYVVENLPDHARKLSKTSRRERRRVREFFESSRFWQWASLFWEEKDPSRSPSDLGPLAMACLLGLKLTVEDLVAPGNRNSLRFDSDRSIRDIYKVLAAAIEGGSTEILSLLINSGASIDGFIKLGEKRTLLSVAVWYGRTEMIALLLDKSNYLSLSDEETNGSTPIDIAVEAGRQSTVRWLHDNGAPLNLGNHPWQRRYLSALHVAVRSHRSGMIPMLLKLGADAREPTRDGDFAFHMAAQLGDLAALEILKPHDVDARDANENTALLRAVEALQKEMVLYLLKEGADVNARNNRGSLGTAAYLALSKRTKDDHQKAREMVELLLCHGFDMQSEEVGVILYAVVESDNILAFSFLQVWPGSFSSRVRLDSAGVWMLASNIRAIDICHSLLQTNAVDVNTCDADGTTALAAAVKRGDIAFCQKLISNCHAKTTVRDKEGRTPLHATTQLWPREVGLEIASLILDHDDSQLSNFMRDNRGLTALHLAVYCGNVEMAKFLLERGAAVDELDTTGRTSLYCCNFRNSVLVTHLLEAGADPTVRAHSGKSAAIRIADSGEEEAMEILFRRGFSFSESDVLEAPKVGKQEEVRISCLLWYIYLNGNIELVQNMSKNGMMSSNDKEMGLKWALEKRKRPVLDLLAPMLEKNQVKEFVGQELVTWLLFPDSEKRTQSILFILLSDYVDLNKAYLPPSERDCRAVHRRITVNPLMKAIERGEHIFVRAMLENQAGVSLSSRFLDRALRLARKEKHEEVANILAGHIETLASQRE
jgi:ankyrin repeat protein